MALSRSLVLLIPQLLLLHVCICTHINMHCYLFVHLAVRHTMAGLKLEELVKREKTVIHPPAISSDEVMMVKGSNDPVVDQQKQEAFDTWLGRYPEDKAGEYNMEKKIATNHGLSLVFSEEPSRRTQDDIAITCPGTTVQTGSMTVAAIKDPHGSHYPRSVPWFNEDPSPGKIMNDNLCSLINFVYYLICLFRLEKY